MTYIRPSQCEQCVPLETTTAGSGFAWSTEIAHETECPNRRNTTETDQ